MRAKPQRPEAGGLTAGLGLQAAGSGFGSDGALGPKSSNRGVMHAEILAMARRHSPEGATHGPAPRQELRTTGTGSNPTAPPAGRLNVSEVERTSDLKNYHFRDAQTCSSSAISRSRLATFLRSSRAKPVVSPGDRGRSMTVASSWRFLARVFWASVSSGLRGGPRTGDIALGLVCLARTRVLVRKC